LIILSRQEEEEDNQAACDQEGQEERQDHRRPRWHIGFCTTHPTTTWRRRKWLHRPHQNSLREGDQHLHLKEVDWNLGTSTTPFWETSRKTKFRRITLLDRFDMFEWVTETPSDIRNAAEGKLARRNL